MVSLDGSGLPLYEQICRALREHVSEGRLRPGSRLASHRTLASELGVSRFTVVAAMERLLAEGYFETRRGSGTFVAGVPPEARMIPARGGRGAKPRAPSVAVTPSLSKRGRAISAVIITGPRFERSEPRAFRPRRPALDVFPIRRWARIVRRQWSVHRHRNLDYGDPAGYKPLREAIARHIALTRGVTCSADQVIVTSGAQQAFDLLFRLLLDAGDAAWMEEPGYLDVRAALVAAGARVVPVPVDPHGLDVAAGVGLARGARLAIVSPSHQYPTGVTLSATRRSALLDWARRSGAWIVEDDYDSYFRYRGRPMSALQHLDVESASAAGAAPRVLYVGTFSKTMFPSLRLGFCVVPDVLIGAVANARAVADRNSPVADQAALAEFIAEGDSDRHLRRSRLVCEERYEAMRDQFDRVLGGAIELGVASAGTHVLGRLIGSGRSGSSLRDYEEIARAGVEEELVLLRRSRYCLIPPRDDAFVLGYGGLSTERIADGAKRLARVIEGYRAVRK